VGDRTSPAARVLRFNAVGVIGWIVQAGVLWLLVASGMAPVPAVALAVLAAAAHNFAWHERFTWPGRPPAERLGRAGLFLLTTGVVSVVSNMALTVAAMRIAHLPIVAANLLAVLATALVNYTLSDRLVFRRKKEQPAAAA
jgi:putative flippase GtrA